MVQIQSANRAPLGGRLWLNVPTAGHKRAAIEFYQSEEKTSPNDASQNVATYVEAHIGTFLAMDAAGTLENEIRR
jgi:hypothetical protein